MQGICTFPRLVHSQTKSVDVINLKLYSMIIIIQNLTGSLNTSTSLVGQKVPDVVDWADIYNVERWGRFKNEVNCFFGMKCVADIFDLTSWSFT